MRARLLLLLAAATLGTWFPAVVASPLRAHVDAWGDQTAQGSVTTEATLAAWSVSVAAGQSVVISWPTAVHVQIWETQNLVASTGSIPIVDNTTASYQLPDSLVDEFDAPTLHAQLGVGDVVWFLPKGSSQVHLNLTRIVFQTREDIAEWTADPGFHPYPQWQALPTGRPGHFAAAGNPTCVDGYVILRGPTLQAGGRSVVTGPVGSQSGLAAVERVRYALLPCKDGTTSATDFHFILRAGTLQVNGNYSATHATLRGQADGVAFDQDAGIVKAVGNLTLRMTWTGASPQTALEGNADYVALDRVVLVEAPDVVPVVATLGAATFLGVVAWVLRRPFGALINRSEPLGHPTRQAIVQLIEASGGLPVARLQEALGVTRATANFHVHVLSRAGLVEVRKLVGKVVVFHPSVDQHQHATEHPVRARILASLREGPATIAELTRAVGVARPTIRHHLAVLTNFGWVRPTGTTYSLSQEQQQVESPA